MAHLIDKDALVAEIEKRIKEHHSGYLMCLKDMLSFINTLEVKEVDLEFITGWFDHIAQIADDRMTLTNQRMTDAHALDEIKCLARNCQEYIRLNINTN